jgi:hypothetical protein
MTQLYKISYYEFCYACIVRHAVWNFRQKSNNFDTYVQHKPLNQQCSVLERDGGTGGGINMNYSYTA